VFTAFWLVSDECRFLTGQFGPPARSSSPGRGTNYSVVYSPFSGTTIHDYVQVTDITCGGCLGIAAGLRRFRRVTVDAGL
jgi:hypothetical protein